MGSWQPFLQALKKDYSRTFLDFSQIVHELSNNRIPTPMAQLQLF
jgi:hypothetical protein